MLVLAGAALFSMAGAVVLALGHAAADHGNEWRLDEPRMLTGAR